MTLSIPALILIIGASVSFGARLGVLVMGCLCAAKWSDEEVQR